MPRADAYRLTNASLLVRLFSTLCLGAGIALFAASWWASVWLASVAVTSERTLSSWGEYLRALAWGTPGVFTVLFVAHFAALVMVLALSVGLFRRTAMRRRFKSLLVAGAVMIAALDATVWLLLPFVDVAVLVAGAVGAVEFLLLLALSAMPMLQMWVYRRWRSEGGRKRVVIVGGGFAGLYCAMKIDRWLGYHRDLELVLLDKNNYFLFPPLLPSVAAGSIETRQVTFPFRRIFETGNVVFRKATVDRIDPERRTLYTRVAFDADAKSGRQASRPSSLGYDVLILAPGSHTNTFRTPGVEEHAFFMRELSDAIAVRNHVIDCFERAVAATSVARQRELLRFVVVGGGPTGVEVATEIHDLIHHVLLSRYPEVDAKTPEVVVVQSGKGILPGWHPKVVGTATEHISSLDMKLVLGERVVEVGPRHVSLKSGERLATRTCVWCTGVKASPLLARSGLPLDDRSGRVRIRPDLRAEGFDDVFVLGDAAHLVDEASGAPLPPLGQVAFQQGPTAADNVMRLLSRERLRPFRYFNFGSLVSVGEHFAAVNLLGVRLSGFLGWLVWRTLYLGKLVGFSNKLRVMLDWTLDLLVERSISQLHAEEEHQGAAGLPEPDVELDLDATSRAVEQAVASLDDLVGEVRRSGRGVTAVLVHEGADGVGATLSVAPAAAGLEVRLDAALPSVVDMEAALSRQDGLLALLRAQGELEVFDEELDNTFVIDASRDAAPHILALKRELLTLRDCRAEVHLGPGSLEVRTPDADIAPDAVARDVGAVLGLWCAAVRHASRAGRTAA